MNDLELAKIEQRIYSIRGIRVILDADLAAVYGVATFRFNEAIKRNKNRFPPDFMFQLSQAEFEALKSQTAISETGKTNSSQIAMSSRKHRGAAYRPYAFTEHGALQAANVLRSQRAVQMSVFVIRAFVKMREHLATNAAILKRLAEIDHGLLLHDSALRDIYQKLLPLLSPPPDPSRPKIGFR
jgi:ORF6N domain